MLWRNNPLRGGQLRFADLPVERGSNWTKAFDQTVQNYRFAMTRVKRMLASSLGP